jgi:hypothetical protein
MDNQKLIIVNSAPVWVRDLVEHAFSEVALNEI